MGEVLGLIVGFVIVLGFVSGLVYFLANVARKGADRKDR